MDGFIEPSIGSDKNQNNRVCPLGEHFKSSSARGATSRKPILGATAAVCRAVCCSLCPTWTVKQDSVMHRWVLFGFDNTIDLIYIVTRRQCRSFTQRYAYRSSLMKSLHGASCWPLAEHEMKTDKPSWFLRPTGGQKCLNIPSGFSWQ